MLPANYPIESLQMYAFSWQFDGKCGYVKAGDCIFKVCKDKIEKECWGREGDLEKVLGLHEDHGEFIEMAKDDPLLRCVVERYPGLRPRTLSLKEAIVIAVAQQNASFKQAWGNVYRLYRTISVKYKAFGREYLSLGEVDENALRRCGFGYRAKTIMEALRQNIDCSNIEELLRVKGIGKYTFALVKMFSCRDYSELPLDRWLERVAEKAYGDWRRLEEFGRWKGLAALLITVALDALPLRKALKRVEEGKVCPSESFSPMTMWQYW
ncbi:hypothetical protein IPA_00335 [Ignicoccus pacificus DSM 13166]|uniref:HhH-GPD domain-containing protein n=1 Tax=Ignicoccus pacificus DSM 13166 TaxID=940294 RepID=A0A977PKB7_9CREN|nr:hypothetical protein IPA_00335 [Ignicoccus pacificus DSM 13166]